jgi:hypothetical protein
MTLTEMKRFSYIVRVAWGTTVIGQSIPRLHCSHRQQVSYVRQSSRREYRVYRFRSSAIDLQIQILISEIDAHRRVINCATDWRISIICHKLDNYNMFSFV